MTDRAAYELRAPTPDDLGPAASVLVADQRAAGSEVVLDASFIRHEWDRRAFDLTTDAWVVTDDAKLVVAYAQVRSDEEGAVESWGVVHPEHRGRGIGTALLDRIEERASVLLRDSPSPRLRHSISAGDRAAATMLRARGLRPIRHFWHMQIDLFGPREPRPAPAGIEVGGVEPGEDIGAVHAVLTAAFSHPDERLPTLDRWADDHARSQRNDLTLWLLARHGRVPVGALIGSTGDDGGWVDRLAVVASHRGRGVASALLQRSFAVFARRGVRRVLLNVDAENATGATAVYERAGMRVVSAWDLWERA